MPLRPLSPVVFAGLSDLLSLSLVFILMFCAPPVSSVSHCSVSTMSTLLTSSVYAHFRLGLDLVLVLATAFFRPNAKGTLAAVIVGQNGTTI